MIQHAIGRGKIIYLALSLLLLISCDRSPQGPVPATQPATGTRVASLVPSATDLLLAMQAGDHLVAVSNYDPDRPPIDRLPRVGDYQNIDWERLAEVRPDVMIVFQSPDRLEQGLRDKAAQLSIKLVNVRTETLHDIFVELARLGEIIGEPLKAADAISAMAERLDSVRLTVADRPRVKTLVLMQESGFAAVGGQTFIDDVLTIAGGDNVVQTAGWPTLDREQVLASGAEAVFVLLPDAGPHVAEQAKQSLAQLSDLPAVRDERVYILTDWYILRSGNHVVELAETFARCLQPQATTSPAQP